MIEQLIRGLFPSTKHTRVALAVASLAIFAACGQRYSDRARATDDAQDTLHHDSIALGNNESIILATTTSTEDSGLLDSLLPGFRAESGIDVKVIAVGTGAALDMARRGNADVVLVHAPASERDYVQSGDLTGGRLLMHNDFLIVGPPDDPVKVRGRSNLSDAMKAIARTGPFVSRGDGSGTEKMELALWKAAAIDPTAVPKREATGQGMGATLNVADQRRGYTLTDRATYLALKHRLTLVPVYEGDATLLNIYHVYVVNPAKHPNVKEAGARRFVEFLVSPGTQRAIGEFGHSRFGQSLFIPDVGKDSSKLSGVSAPPLS
ncbi:MAG: substrate-binding domain-containing protein [Gemmatimonadaceae bacterium]|nr:substrate-binding domain-containing protein [Gemmatimonadaceae bacterium]